MLEPVTQTLLVFTVDLLQILAQIEFNKALENDAQEQYQDMLEFILLCTSSAVIYFCPSNRRSYLSVVCVPGIWSFMFVTSSPMLHAAFPVIRNSDVDLCGRGPLHCFPSPIVTLCSSLIKPPGMEFSLFYIQWARDLNGSRCNCFIFVKYRLIFFINCPLIYFVKLIFSKKLLLI